MSNETVAEIVRKMRERVAYQDNCNNRVSLHKSQYAEYCDRIEAAYKRDERIKYDLYNRLNKIYTRYDSYCKAFDTTGENVFVDFIKSILMDIIYGKKKRAK